MTPAARVQAAIDVLTALEKTDQPADRLVRDYFRARRYAGSKDRAAVAERVFSVLRHRGALAWAIQDEAPRALVLASVAEAGEDPDTLFTGQNYAPPSLSDDERKRLKSLRTDLPLHAEGAFPAFLEPELTRAFGDRLLREMTALLERAPTDLRANSLKASRDDVLRLLHAQGYDAAPTPHSPIGIRIASGGGGLDKTKEFEAGLFEFQDEAAQIASILVAARPDMRILDLAAGAGGKALALAAAMRDQGEIVACDVRQPALQQLAIRAKRAGATNIKTFLLEDAAPAGRFDAVLVDAPCSGSGTWRRQPDLRWKLTPAVLTQRIAAQDALLDRAAAFVKPGGRLIYATCSVLPCENQERVAAFLRRHPRFTPLSAADAWTRETGTPPPPGMAEDFRATPYSTGTDGFFTALLIHTPAASGALDKGEG
ncbi:MAG TPA: RsmB/NOP family class I SAM-dependent RNA methyltransferase [Rhizomicrobium sp.]|nr:RsmB/NOP family class I SAM-dependent RNA methyltransferase [Rhizomicrobium sp.]